MIVPSKHLSQDRALLTVGATILRHLSQPITVSGLWEEITRPTPMEKTPPRVRFDAFVLALDLLFLMGAIDLRDGLLSQKSP